MKRTTLAEIYQGTYNWVALALVLLAAASAVELVAYARNGDERYEIWATILAVATTLVLAFAGVSLLLRQARFLYGLTGPADLKRRWQWRHDDYAVEALKRAAATAGVVAGAVFGVLETFDSIALPGSYVVKLGVCVLSGSFGITYLILSLRGAGDD